MGLRAIISLWVTAVLIMTESACGAIQEDGISMAALAASMNLKFQQIFDRFDQLELKVNRILQRDEDQTGAVIVDNLWRFHDENRDNSGNGSAEAETNAHVNKVPQLENILSELASIPFCQRQAAHVRQPVVIAALNTSQNISCESYGTPLNSCLWARRASGNGQVVVIDKNVADNDKRATVGGLSFTGDNSGDLYAGKCTLNIESLTNKDEGLWTCTLIFANSTIFSGAVHVSLLSVDGKYTQVPHLERTENECENYETKCLNILKQVFHEGQHCAPCPNCDITAKGKLIAAEDKLRRKERTLKDLAALTASLVPSSNESPKAPQRMLAEVNTSLVLPCEFNGQSLNSCLWGRTIRGQRDGIFVDQQVVQNGGKTDVDGISYVGNGLENGNCSIRIASVQQDNVGTWSCTSVSKAGTVFQTEVHIHTDKIQPSIFVTTWGSGGIQAYSFTTSETTQVVTGGTNFYGIAYDPIQDRIYWSNSSSIKRANKDGSRVETVLSTSTYGTIYALRFDWIGGNLYAGTVSGYILACYAGTKRAFKCYTVLSGQGDIRGLALDPNQGHIFWTTSTGGIFRAGMDGSDRTQIAAYTHSDEKKLRGITIDFQSSRLFWVSAGGDKIQSSNMNGGSVETIVSVPSGSWPIGIGIFGDRIYWTNHNSKTVNSCTKAGQDVQTLHTGAISPINLAVVLEVYPPSVRVSDCENLSCTKMCVLTPTSSRCLS